MLGQTYLSQFILFGSIDIAIILAGYSFSENWKLYGWPPKTNLSDKDRLNIGRSSWQLSLIQSLLNLCSFMNID